MMSQTATDRTLNPMIERLSDMPPGTVGFRAAGKIERKDYDDVLPPGSGEHSREGIEDPDEIEPARRSCSRG